MRGVSILTAPEYLGMSLRGWASGEACAVIAMLAGPAVGETVILLTPPLPLVAVSIGMERGCQQNDSPAERLGRAVEPGCVGQSANVSHRGCLARVCDAWLRVSEPAQDKGGVSGLHKKCVCLCIIPR